MTGTGRRYAALVDRAERLGVPLSVTIEFTGRCNLSCQHCYLDLEHPPTELSTPQWKQIIDDLAALGTLFVTLTGGEVFLRRDAFEIIEYIRSRGLALRVFTTGTQFRRDEVRRLAALRGIGVELSLYSAGAAVHDGITRRKGSHRKTLRTAVLLRRAGVPVLLKCPVMRPNLDETSGVVDVARRIGAQCTFDPTIIMGRDGRCEPTEMRASPEDIARVLARPELKPPSELRGRRSPADPVCAIAARVAVIQPNGDVMPCSVYPTPAGNVQQQSFAQIWTGSPLLRTLRGITVGSQETPCAGCVKSGYCGRCSSMAMIEDGDFLGPSRAACDFAEARELAMGMPARGIGPDRPGHSRGVSRTRLEILS